MHEYSIVQSLLEKVEEHAEAHGATAVSRLAVRIGELSGVEADLLVTAFSLVRERTICAHAELEIAAIPARWACPRCDATVPRGAILRCPTCGDPARLASGDEIILDQIEMEVDHV